MKLLFIFLPLIICFVIMHVWLCWTKYKYLLHLGPRVPAPGYKIMTDGKLFVYQQGTCLSTSPEKHIWDVIDVTWRYYKADLKRAKLLEKKWSEVEFK